MYTDKTLFKKTILHWITGTRQEILNIKDFAGIILLPTFLKLEINNKNMMGNLYLENKEHTSDHLWVRKGNFKLLNKIS